MFDRAGGAEKLGEGSNISVQTGSSLGMIPQGLGTFLIKSADGGEGTHSHIYAAHVSRQRSSPLFTLQGCVCPLPVQPPKSCTVLSGGHLPKMLRGSYFCSVLAQIPCLPAGCLLSAAHEPPAPSSGSGNGFFPL